MSNAYVGEVRMWSSRRIPVDWLECDGRALPRQQYQDLHAVIGTTYGDPGNDMFNLPDMRGRIPIGAGQGPGLSQRSLGQPVGSAQVSLQPQHLPPHSHVPRAAHADATDIAPGPGRLLGIAAPNVRPYVDLAKPTGATAKFSQQAIDYGPGQSAAHDNLMPSAGVVFIICTQGLFPSTN